MDTMVRDTLVLPVLTQAICRKHPPEGLIIHTDRGCQFTVRRFQSMCIRCGFRQSMSRKGNPYDNAIMESFYRILKRGLVQDVKYDLSLIHIWEPYSPRYRFRVVRKIHQEDRLATRYAT